MAELGKGSSVFESLGLQALSQLNPHQGKHSLVSTSPIRTQTHIALYTQQQQMFGVLEKNQCHSNAAFVKPAFAGVFCLL